MTFDSNDIAVRTLHEHEQSCRERFCDRCNRVRCDDCGGRAAPDSFPARCEPCTRRRVLRLPRAHHAATLDAPWLRELVGADSIERVARIASRVASPVLFVGPTGAGKTSCLAAALQAAGGRPSLFVPSYQLARARATHPLGEGEPEIVRDALRAPVLGLDELGAEEPSQRAHVVEVLHTRHAEGRPTWATTPLAPRGDRSAVATAIAALFGGGIARRLLEGGELVVLGGRGKGAA